MTPRRVFEQRRRAVNFINDHQLADLCAEERVRIFQPPPIRRALQIEIDRAILFPSGCNASRDGRLARLAGAKQHDCRHLAETLFYYGFRPSCEHLITPEI